MKGAFGTLFHKYMFDKLANGEGRANKVPLFFKAHLIEVASDCDDQVPRPKDPKKLTCVMHIMAMTMILVARTRVAMCIA